MGILETLMGLVKIPLQDTESNPDRIADFGKSIPDIESGHTAAGLNNQFMPEQIPNFVSAENEKVIAGRSNSWIVLGRDRPSNMVSGYGGQGATSAGSIDLVVGRQPFDSQTNVDPNFITDAARIHISQTTDVDKNFNLAAGSIGRIDGRSAIGMKADEIRVVGRNGVKIITEGRGSTNSKGGKLRTTVGIDLIAGNDDNTMGPLQSGRQTNPFLHPIPKGLELVDCLNDMMGLMDDLAAMVSANNSAIHQNATNVAQHMHPVIFGLAVPSPNGAAMSLATKGPLYIKATLPMYLHRINTQTFRVDYLKPVGDKWICSRYNNTN